MTEIVQAPYDTDGEAGPGRPKGLGLRVVSRPLNPCAIVGVRDPLVHPCPLAFLPSLKLVSFWAGSSLTSALYHDFQTSPGIFFWQVCLGKGKPTPHKLGRDSLGTHGLRTFCFKECVRPMRAEGRKTGAWTQELRSWGSVGFRDPSGRTEGLWL